MKSDQKDLNLDARARIGLAKRVVIKVGTNILVKPGGSLHLLRMQAVVRQVEALRRAGKEVLLVSSGAIGAGLEPLGFKRRPRTLPELQIAASIGQLELMSEWRRVFSERSIGIGQVLLTHDDLKNRKRHLNMRNAILGLLSRGFVPVVNENDVIAVDEIKFGDNDVLAALLGVLVGADLLLLLSTTNGLRRSAPGKSRKGSLKAGRAERVPFVPQIDQEVMSWADGKGSEMSTGGMETKLAASEIMLKVGSVVVIADGRDPKNIQRVFGGQDVGTLFGIPDAVSQSGINGRKRWLAFYHRPLGSVVVDSGAVSALLNNGVSLLPVGVVKVVGSFEFGELINVTTEQGKVIARGLANYSAEQIELIRGLKSRDIGKLADSTDFGPRLYEEVIHRDNLVIIAKR